MLRISICDDEFIQIEAIQNELKALELELNETFTVECFMDGSELLQKCANLPDDFYDIIYLDIVMTKEGGIDTAKQLRDKGWKESKFIFVTCHEKYIRDLFVLDTVGYVDKPIRRDAFKKAFMDAYRKIMIDNKNVFSLKKDKSERYVRSRSIVYIDIFQRVITLHMKNGETHKFHATISEVWEELKNMPEFVMPNKSIILNLEYVQTLDIGGFHLDNQQVIPIRQKNSGATLDKYFAYIHLKGV